MTLKESKGESLRRFFCMRKQPRPLDVPDSVSISVTEQPSSSRTSSGEYESLFNYFDEDGDGKVSSAELRSRMRTVGTELSAEEAETAVGSTDSDGDGLLGFEDFLKLVEADGEEERGNSLRDAFGVYAADGQDYITAKSLRLALWRLGESRSVDECKVMIRRFDLNGDWVLSFDEFKIMMF